MDTMRVGQAETVADSIPEDCQWWVERAVLENQVQTGTNLETSNGQVIEGRLL